jgi:hypothetical protein
MALCSLCLCGEVSGYKILIPELPRNQGLGIVVYSLR